MKSGQIFFEGIVYKFIWKIVKIVFGKNKNKIINKLLYVYTAEWPE